MRMIEKDSSQCRRVRIVRTVMSAENGVGKVRGVRRALLALLCVSIAGWGQSFNPADRHVPSVVDALAGIVFGDAETPLYGPWRFQIGDSPMDPLTHAPLWAEPGFDDSGWEKISLKPQPGWKDPYNGDPRYIPGWTAGGHPGYMGYAWYRLRVPAASKSGSPLALAMPTYVDDGYQVFANGQ